MALAVRELCFCEWLRMQMTPGNVPPSESCLNLATVKSWAKGDGVGIADSGGQASCYSTQSNVRSTARFQSW